MKVPLSIENLIAGGARTVLSVVGISIAVVLIFMQLGFLGAVIDTAVVFYDKMKFDLLASSKDYYNFSDAGKFDRRSLQVIQGVPGVADVYPVHVRIGKWNYEQRDVQRGMLLMGIDTSGTTFDIDEVNRQVGTLVQEQFILVDRGSKPRFLGAKNRRGFVDQEIGLTVEINGKQRKLAGYFKIGTGLAADGSCILGESSFRSLYPDYSADDVGIGLIQLAPGADPESVRQAIYNAFHHSGGQAKENGLARSSPGTSPQFPIDIFNRTEVERREMAYWMFGTPVGFIFIAGVVIAFIVGGIIVYIVLSADISRQISEYATLKAMGYSNSFLSVTVLQQSFVLAVLSFLIALVVSLVLYKVVGSAARLPINMPWHRPVFVFLTSLLMSTVSALIAMQKLRQADPADLF